LAAGIALHRAVGTWQHHVDAFVALTEFQRELVVSAGLPRERVHVKPNFYPGAPEAIAWDRRRDCVVFVGRLSPEKGVLVLLEAWKSWGDSAPELRIVGDGVQRSELERFARVHALRNVSFLGQVSPRSAEQEIARAKLLVVPSVWFEGFPMVVREAFAFGTPVAVSGIGPLPDLVQRGAAGFVFFPNDSRSLLKVVRDAWERPTTLCDIAARSRLEFETKYAEAGNHQLLMDIYEAAMRVRRERSE
jgi:glycosyltransferase involved in cell wall biosynthesis